jgi:hypothetical protein
MKKISTVMAKKVEKMQVRSSRSGWIWEIGSVGTAF